MSYRFRTIVYWVFVVTFICLTTFISLKASGYRLNIGWPPKFNRLLQKTGMLIVATEPKGATISINGKLQRSLASFFNFKTEDTIKTPAKIKSLAPGQYELKLEENGYWPFTKNIWIHEGESVYVDEITLLPKNQILKIGEVSTSSAMIVKIGRFVIGARVYDAETSALVADFSNILGADIKDSRLYGSDIYYINSNGLNYFNIKTKENVLAYNNEISGSECLGFSKQGAYISMISRNLKDGNIFLRSYSIKNFSLQSEQALPAGGNYQLGEEEAPYLQIYDNKLKNLYLANPGLQSPIIAAISGVNSYSWISSSQLAYSNGLEIYRYDINSGKSQLLTRLGKEISGLAWHPKGYLIYAAGGDINLLNYQNSANSLTLASFSKVYSISISADGKYLDVNASDGSQDGLYRLMLE